MVPVHAMTSRSRASLTSAFNYLGRATMRSARPRKTRAGGGWPHLYASAVEERGLQPLPPRLTAPPYHAPVDAEIASRSFERAGPPSPYVAQKNDKRLEVKEQIPRVGAHDDAHSAPVSRKRCVDCRWGRAHDP